MSATLKSFHIFSFPWSEVAPTVTKIIPPLLHTEHKGAMGRIGVLGGSKDYTGAPFYAADAALKFGGDLSTVLSSQLASIPIKCYSPELIVTPFYRDDCFEFFDYTTATAEKFCSSPSSASKTTRQEADMMAQSEIARAEAIIAETLPRLHSLVIGPGLGRNEHVGKLILSAIAAARERNIFLVIDADGLWTINKNYTSIHGYSRCVITPNAMEFSRLVDVVQADISQNILHDCTDGVKRSFYELLLQDLSSPDVAVNTRAVSIALGGVTVLRKAEHDVISSGSDVFILKESGSARRCGGQGDILAGCVSVALHWQNKTAAEMVHASNELLHVSSSEQRISQVDLFQAAELTGIQADKPAGRERYGNVLASVLASCVVKRASRLAFEQRKRSMTAPDVLNYIGIAFEKMLEN